MSFLFNNPYQPLLLLVNHKDTIHFMCLHPAAARMVLTGLAWSRDLWKNGVLPFFVISTTLALILGNTENQWTLLGCVASQVFCWSMWIGTSCLPHHALTRPFTGHLPPLALCLLRALPWPLGPKEPAFLHLALLLLLSTWINHTPYKLPTTFDSYSDVNKAANADANINSHDPVVLH